MSENAKRVVLQASGLTKKFGKHTAVNDVSFDVHQGDIFGFLGPNGAGKSTTMYMMAGLVHPTSGDIRIFGERHTAFESVRSRVGFLIETPAFYEFLSGYRNLEVLARLQPDVPRARIREVLEAVGLSDRAKDKVGHYSHGMKQRLGIAQALLNRPKLLMLDEPTNGLDPEGSGQIWELLRNLVRDEQMTVFISSHLLHEVEEGCNRIAVINQGIIVACDQVRSLLFFSKEDYLLLFDDAEKRAKAEGYLKEADGVELIDTGGHVAAGHEEHALRVRLQHGISSGMMGQLVSLGAAPRAMIPQRKTLKQFFLELTRRQPERAQLT